MKVWKKKNSGQSDVPSIYVRIAMYGQISFLVRSEFLKRYQIIGATDSDSSFLFKMDLFFLKCERNFFQQSEMSMCRPANAVCAIQIMSA